MARASGLSSAKSPLDFMLKLLGAVGSLSREAPDRLFELIWGENNLLAQVEAVREEVKKEREQGTQRRKAKKKAAMKKRKKSGDSAEVIPLTTRRSP